MFNRSTQDANISQIMKLINAIKQSIYKVVYLMLKQGEESFYLALFFSLIQLLQIQYLAFGSKILFVWQNTTITNNLNEFLKYFVISAHLINQEFSLYITIFYTAFTIVLLAYILFILFAFSFKVAALPLLFLKRLIHLFITVAFVPFMLLFFGLLSCQTDSYGKNIWTYNHKIECWGNEHYIHGIFAIVIIVLFQILTSTMCLIFFESKNVQANAYSCRSGRPYSQYHINVLIQIMSYQLLELPRFYTLLLFIYFGTSFILFYQIHNDKPFYSKPMQKFWSIISALNVWTTLMEIFAYFLEGLYFTDIIYGWIGGIPLIILIIIKEAIIEVDLLSSNINKPISGQQIVILCEYLQSDLDKNDQHSTLILDAFLEIHKQTCYRNDCVLKIKKNLNEKTKHPSLQDNERVQIIIELISQIYYDGIKQFPQDVFLRLNYSYFLIDRLKLKQQALSELQQAELNGPSFDHLFTIYRYKRIMEDDLQEQQQDNISQVDLVTEIAFQTQSKQLISQIEKSSLIFIDFWAQLQEEIPDIGRIRNLGFKILDSASQVQEQWNRLKRLNQRASKLNRLIGKYYTQILNDEETGQKLLEQSRVNQNQRFNAVDQDDIYNEQLPTLTILTEIDKIGTISNVNKAACSLLGFTKTDLVNRKLNLIQPDLFSKYHDHFIENYLENVSDCTQSSSEIPVLVKNKQGYIVPCQLNIRMIQTINSGIFMCGTLKQEIFHKPVSIFICLTNGIIENINAPCIRMFGLELKAIQIRPINIMEIFPDIFDRQKEFLSKNGGIITYSFGTRQRNSTQHTSFQDLEIENAEILDEKNQMKEIQFLCYLQEIKFTCIEDEVIQNKVQGYIIKLEKIKVHEKSLLLAKKKTISNQQQFRVSCNNNQEIKYIFECCESQEVTIRIDQSIIWEDQTKVSQIIDIQQQSQQQVFLNLGDGIRTVRLQGDKIMDIDESKSEELDDEVVQSVFQQSDNINEDEKKEKKDFVHLYRSKAQLIFLLQNSKIPRTSKNFRIGINLISILITLIIFLEYFINDQLISNVFESLPLISQNNIRLSTALSIQSILQDLRTLHYDEYPLLKDEIYGYQLVEQQFRHWLGVEIQSIMAIQKELTLIDVDISDQYPDAAKNYVKQNVQMSTQEGNTQNYTYNEALQSIIVKALTINSSSLSDINDENGDVYYLEYNIFGSITQSSVNSADYFLHVLIYRCNTLDNSTTAFLITSSILIILELLLILLFFIKLQVVNQAVLLLFLDLNQKQIKQFYQKCENFITSLQIGEDDDDFQSDQDENNDNKEKQDQDNAQIRKKRKKFKDSDQFFKKLMLISILIALIFGLYFVSIFITIENVTLQAQELIPLFNQTSFLECYYRYSDNALKKQLEVENYHFPGNFSNVLDYLITLLYNLDAEIHQLHSKNSDLLSSNYLDVFNNIFILAPCDYIPLVDSSIDTQTCLEFNDGVLQQGLSIGMANYFETFRQILNQYKRYDSTMANNLTYNISTNARLNYMMNLMNTNQAYNMRLMQERYVRAAYSYLNKALVDSIISEETAYKNFKVAIAISSLIFLFFLFFFVWIPIIFKLLGELRKNRLMLTLISLSTIHETASIRQYIRKMINR